MPCTALDAENSRWSEYCPSIGVAILYAILFGSTTLVHLFQAIRYGKKRLCWPLIMGGIWETGAFITRALAIVHPASEGLFDTQYALVLISPLWINAFAYVLLGRLVYYYIPSRRLLGLPTGAFGAIFVLCDMIAFAVQVVGVMFTLSIDPKAQETGLEIYSIGNGIQQAFICIVCIWVWRFVVEVKRVEGSRDWSSARRMVRVLAIVLALITLRILFRLIEFAGGVYSSVTMHVQGTEAYQYIFDSTLMLLAMVAIHYPHPGMVLTGEDSEPPYGRAKRELKKARKEAKKRAKLEGSFSDSISIEMGPYAKLTHDEALYK